MWKDYADIAETNSPQLAFYALRQASNWEQLEVQANDVLSYFASAA